MSQQSGVQLYTQSLNGLITIDNADTIQVFELDAEIINVDSLTVNNLLTTPNISNTTIGTITQTNTNIITQTGTGTNILKNTNFNGNVVIDGDLTLTGILDYDVLDIDCENLIVQNDASLNNVNIIGNITQTGVGTNILKDKVITGDFEVDEVLQTSTTADIVYNITDNPSALTALGSIGTFITFSVQKRYNVNFTINFNVAISKKETGTLSGTALYTENGIDGNGVTFFLYKNGVLQTSKTNTTSNGGGVLNYQTTITTGAYSYEAYCANCNSFFTINHTSLFYRY